MGYGRRLMPLKLPASAVPLFPSALLGVVHDALRGIRVLDSPLRSLIWAGFSVAWIRCVPIKGDTIFLYRQGHT